MNSRYFACPRHLPLLACVLVGVVVTNSSMASPSKLEVCHIPPNDLLYFHTVTISETALPAHQGHGDLIGACNGLCADLCDDGDACTIDDSGDCETAGCPAERELVDCDDSNACTVDSCNPLDGVCVNEEVVVCEASDLCHVASCDPLTGECAETEKVCGIGEICNLQNGECEQEGVAPVITNFSVVSVGSRTITFQWHTDQPANSQIYFRRQGIGEFELGTEDPALVTDHLIVLPTPLGGGLLSNTNYESFARSVTANGLSDESAVLLVRTRR